MTGRRDTDRARVYEAEHLVQRLLDRSAEFPVVEIAGSRLTLPVERRFGDLAGVQRYVDTLLALNWVRRTWPRAEVPVRVRRRAGATRAHYERAGAVLAVPDAGWALREMVVVHEIAHHLAPEDEVAHGPGFRTRFLELVTEIVGPEVALLLRITLHDLGVHPG